MRNRIEIEDLPRPLSYVVRFVGTFLFCSFVFSFAARVLIPLDTTPLPDPELNAWQDRVASIVGPIIIVGSLLAALLETTRLNRKPKRPLSAGK